MSGRAGDEKEMGSGKEGEVTEAGSGGTGWLRAPNHRAWGPGLGGRGGSGPQNYRVGGPRRPEASPAQQASVDSGGGVAEMVCYGHIIQ